MRILRAHRHPNAVSETACGRRVSHHPMASKAAKPAMVSLEISTPEPCCRYFRRRSLRVTYTIPNPLASRARLDGSGTAMKVAPAFAVDIAAQVAKSATREAETKRPIIIPLRCQGSVPEQ